MPTTLPESWRQFQSTPPRGGRRQGKGCCLRGATVSIHAPAWGATSCSPGRMARSRVSIHAPAWGATVLLWQNNKIRSWFQSTPPRGGRHHATVLDTAIRRFQSTPPRGGRHARQGPEDSAAQVSIHAPAWGATRFETLPSGVHDVSIHAPAWGATTYEVAQYKLFLQFQSTPPRGGRLLEGLGYTVEWKFQSTPPRGGRPRCQSRNRSGSGFNPRPRVGGDKDVDNALPTAWVSIHAPAWGAT